VIAQHPGDLLHRLKIGLQCSGYPDGRGRDLKTEYPAPHWRPTVVESDTRIPAGGEDLSRFEYRIPERLHAPIRVNARLIYRKAYKKWMDAKGFAEEEMVLARKTLTVAR
jgi:hypothetical protein